MQQVTIITSQAYDDAHIVVALNELLSKKEKAGEYQPL
jgi:hypothetical protein